MIGTVLTGTWLMVGLLEMNHVTVLAVVLAKAKLHGAYMVSVH